ncbi:MAG: winged helix-turn-helix domain-containing protein [Pseudomonadota bacterium]
MIHQFGEFEIDTDLMVVKRAGAPVTLRPRPYALFEYLVENQDRVVSKDEMIATVWQGKAVSDAALTSAVRELRKAIGDPGGPDGLIRTFYGRGMRFVAPRTGETAPAAPIAPGQAASRAQSVVAVLPLSVISADPDDKYIAEGISDEIIAKLSRFGLIGVLSRSSSHALCHQALSAREIGDRLAAHYVLEGSLRRNGNALRLTTHLVDVESETHVWTETFDIDQAEDRPSTSQPPATVDPETATTTVATSTITVIYECDNRRAQAKPAEELTAWENYCRGYAVFCTLDPERQWAARDYFTAAIRQRPDFGEAYATLAYSICVRTMTPGADPGNTDLRGTCLKALELARKALSIDARVPFAWVALGRCFFALGELEEAISATRKAIELNPHLGWAHIRLGMCLIDRNAPSEALAHFDQGLRTSPQDSLRVLAIGGKSIAMVLLERYEEAIALSRAAQLLPDAGLTAHLGEVCALGHLKRCPEALDAVRRARKAYKYFGIRAVKRQKPFVNETVHRHLIEGLELAGLGDETAL